VNHNVAAKFYMSGLFILMISNGISGIFAAVGVRGIAFYHIQMLLLILCAGHAGVLLLRGQIRIATDPVLVRLLLLSMSYTALSGVLLLRFGDVRPAYVALILYTLLFHPFATTVMLGCGQSGYAIPDLSTASIPNWIAWASVTVLLFGWVQFAVRDPILRVTNSENVSKLVETNLLGTFRPPSVFESSFQYGLFAVLVFCLSTAYAIYGHGGARSWALSFLALASVGLSQTRNVYLCGACAFISILVLKRASSKRSPLRLFRSVPWGYVAVSITGMLWAVLNFLASDLRRTEDLADASSAMARVSGWLTAWQNLVTPGSVFDVCFGYGITQAGHASDYRFLYPQRGEGLFIDSTFFNLFLFQGLIGLSLFLVIYWTIWRRLLNQVQEHWEPLTVGLTCFVSTFLAAGVLNIVNGQWWGVVLALSFLVLANRQDRTSDVCVR
jgi:hypothetical protein